MDCNIKNNTQINSIDKNYNYNNNNNNYKSKYLNIINKNINFENYSIKLDKLKRT